MLAAGKGAAPAVASAVGAGGAGDEGNPGGRVVWAFVGAGVASGGQPAQRIGGLVHGPIYLGLPKALPVCVNRRAYRLDAPRGT